MSRLSRRVLAFISGINDPRPGLARIAAAVRRSERSVKRATVELQRAGCIEVGHSGHGLPAKIRVIKDPGQVLSPESKMSPERLKVAPEQTKMAPERPGIKDLGKVLEQSKLASDPEILKLVKTAIGTFELGGYYDPYGQKWLRLGIRPNEQTMALIASVLGTAENYRRWREIIGRELSGDHGRFRGWGVAVMWARDVAALRKPPGRESVAGAKEAHA